MPEARRHYTALLEYLDVLNGTGVGGCAPNRSGAQFAITISICADLESGHDEVEQPVDLVRGRRKVFHPVCAVTLHGWAVAQQTLGPAASFCVARTHQHSSHIIPRIHVS